MASDAACLYFLVCRSVLDCCTVTCFDWQFTWTLLNGCRTSYTGEPNWPLASSAGWICGALWGPQPGWTRFHVSETTAGTGFIVITSRLHSHWSFHWVHLFHWTLRQTSSQPVQGSCPVPADKALGGSRRGCRCQKGLFHKLLIYWLLWGGKKEVSTKPHYSRFQKSQFLGSKG